MSTVRYNVPMVNQQFSPVCWLACATMILQFKRGYTPSTEGLGQTGDDFRTPGMTVDSVTTNGAAECSHLRRLGFVVTQCSGIRDPRTLAMAAPRQSAPLLRSSEPSEELIHWVLVNHGPFILRHFVGSFWYGPNWRVPPHNPGDGHSVVVTGIDTARNIVYFNNPWGDRDVNTSVRSIVHAIRRWEAAGSPSIAYL